jgi:hypothetical protein
MAVAAPAQRAPTTTTSAVSILGADIARFETLM